MPDYRLRARLAFVPGNGMATWARDQNAVRLTMTHAINPGRPDAEPSVHTATGDIYVCDLIFTDQALALDTWNTLIAVCVPGYLRAASGRDISWMNLHACEHQGTPTPCPPPTHSWTNGA